MLRSLFLTLALALLPAAAGAQTAAPMTPDQRQAIEQVVRDYLLNNPEILRDAFQALERRENEASARQAAEALQRNADLLFRTGRHAVLGNPNGDVTIVEFFDYNCPYCRRGHADLQELLRTDPNVRLVIKEYPVLGPGSLEAASISVQLINHPRFREFYSRLMSGQGQVNRARALAVARELGIDPRPLEAGADGPAAREAIQQALTLGQELNITGTPSYVIGNEIVVGAVGLDAIRRRVASMRQCGRTSCG
jgi:protein-disulfide isomerase